MECGGFKLPFRQPTAAPPQGRVLQLSELQRKISPEIRMLILVSCLYDTQALSFQDFLSEKNEKSINLQQPEGGREDVRITYNILRITINEVRAPGARIFISQGAPLGI